MVKLNDIVVKSGNKAYFKELGKNDFVQIKNAYFKYAKDNMDFVKVYQYDNTAPIVNLSTAVNCWTSSSTYVLKGTIEDIESGIKDNKLILNYSYPNAINIEIPININGSFETDPIQLTNGTNVFTLYAYDNANNEFKKEFSIYYDTAAPVLNIASPTSGSRINGSTITFGISGSVADSQSGIESVTINGSKVAVNDAGGFYRELTVGDSARIYVTATDKVGRATTRYIDLSKGSTPVYESRYWSSGVTGWNNKWGAGHYCDNCGVAWESDGHCSGYKQVLVRTDYWYNVNVI